MSKTILMIEDTEDNRQILRDLFSSTGYFLIEAGDGATGIAMAQAHNPDLILMDIQLPVLDGYETTCPPKADPTTSHIPIIAVTSYALADDEAKVRAAGCDGYVTKPFSPRLLLAQVRDGRSTPGSPQPSPRWTPPLALDVIRHSPRISFPALILTGIDAISTARRPPRYCP